MGQLLIILVSALISTAVADESVRITDPALRRLQTQMNNGSGTNALFQGLGPGSPARVLVFTPPVYGFIEQLTFLYFNLGNLRVQGFNQLVFETLPAGLSRLYTELKGADQDMREHYTLQMLSPLFYNLGLALVGTELTEEMKMVYAKSLLKVLDKAAELKMFVRFLSLEPGVDACQGLVMRRPRSDYARNRRSVSEYQTLMNPRYFNFTDRIIVIGARNNLVRYGALTTTLVQHLAQEAKIPVFTVDTQVVSSNRNLVTTEQKIWEIVGKGFVQGSFVPVTRDRDFRDSILFLPESQRSPFRGPRN